jgi:two-component system, NtrC family, response regulator HydG
MKNSSHDILDAHLAKKIIDSMTEGVFAMDANGMISHWNRSMERITGFTAQEALGRSCELLRFSSCFGKDCPGGANYCKIFEHGPPEAKECLLRHKDGHDIPVIKNAGTVKDKHNRIIGAVETVTDLTELKRALQRAEDIALRLGEVYRLGNIIGKSDAMQQVFEAIKVAAASDATILIQGESGTGKELIAGAIHHNSLRKEGPLVTVNCSALSETLLESELFGHVKGAYTGAVRDRVGRFEQAREGTLFLDEIGELSPFIQVKLLRVLQEREIERVGDSKTRQIDIRIITATKQDLPALLHSGQFREDLYYRLKVFPIHVPPLRERKKDVPLLTDHFIDVSNKKTGKRIKGISQIAMRRLMDHTWPGNVRELENAIEHAFVLCNNDRIELIDLPVEIRETHTAEGFYNVPIPPHHSNSRPGKKLSKKTLLDLLDQCDWNKAEVGRRVGISRTAIWKHMKKWDIPLNPAG